jgi:dienelactone hydrolase
LVLASIVCLPVPGVAATSVPAPATVAGAPLPEEPGPFPTYERTLAITVESPDRSGIIRADLYATGAPGRRPFVVLAHGCCDTKADFANWGRRLASRGVTVLVADRRGLESAVDDDTASPLANAAALTGEDPRGDADDLLRLLGWAVQQDRTPGSVLAGRVDAHRLALAGHSMGGWLATVAATRAATQGISLAALVLLDNFVGLPGSTTAEVARSVHVPTVVLASTDTGNPALNLMFCEQTPSTPAGLLSPRATYANLPASTPRLGLEILGSSHNQFEDPEDAIDQDTTDPTHTRLHQRYAMAWLEYWLQGDRQVLPYLGGIAAQADQRKRAIRLLGPPTR